MLSNPPEYLVMNSELRTQIIAYSTIKLQMILKVDILVNHKNIWS